MTKQHVLEEIKRLALANGGKAPGRLTFYNATGIKEQDWSGKFWPRWSEAVREAGFIPNAMTAGYEKDVLIKRLIGLVRDLGKFPVFRELRLKAYADKSFPSTKTYETHFGSKSDLIAAVLGYCQKHSGFEDVQLLCEKASSSGTRSAISAEHADISEKIGIVYLIRSGRFYKIGKTNSIGRREYDLAIQLAEKPTTIHVIKTDDPDGIERYWHQRFAGKRKNGEWFDLSSSEVKAFKKWIRIV